VCCDLTVQMKVSSVTAWTGRMTAHIVWDWAVDCFTVSVLWSILTWMPSILHNKIRVCVWLCLHISAFIWSFPYLNPFPCVPGTVCLLVIPIKKQLVVSRSQAASLLHTVSSSVQPRLNPLMDGHIKTAEQRTTIRQYGDWYTGRWWVGCYIWYSEGGLGRALALPSPSSLYQM